MVLIGPWEFEALWIAVSIGLYIALAGIGFGLYPAPVTPLAAFTTMLDSGASSPSRANAET